MWLRLRMAAEKYLAGSEARRRPRAFARETPADLRKREAPATVCIRALSRRWEERQPGAAI